MILLKHKTLLILFVFIILGTFLRSYNLFWGAPYYFHPDERNIAATVTQLSFPQQLNPHFFAYGSLPIYVIYFIGIVINFLRNFSHTTPIFTVSFEQAIIIGRIFSCLFSVGLIPLLYSTGKKLGNSKTGLLAAFFTTTSIGFIQYAHFSTFEMWLTFFGTVLFYLFLLFLQKQKKITLVFIGIIFGTLCSIKISSIIFLFPIIILLGFSTLHKHKHFFALLKTFLFSSFIVFLFGTFCFVLSNPFVFITPNEFLSSMQYESSVVLNTLPVFYTQGFIHTTPFIYQIFYVFPFILNPFLLIIFLPSFIFILYVGIKKHLLPYVFLLLFFLILLCSQGSFYAKWTRYMIPTLPFIYLIISVTLVNFLVYRKLVAKIVIGTISILCGFYALSFIYIAYFQKDSRITAMEWATNNISSQTTILSEVYDLGIVPFNQTYSSITLINFYDLEQDIQEQERFNQLKKNATIIILPSQRILKTRINNPKKFSQGFSFYNKLLQEDGYKKIYQTPCDFLCKIIYVGDPVFSVEETINVFDRPTVYIFKRI